MGLGEYNIYGGLGDGTTTKRNSPVQVGSSTNNQSIAAGNYHSLLIKTDGTLWAWGLNDNGQVGNGATIQKNSPVQIGNSTNNQSIAAGALHSLLLKNDGSLLAFGYNGYGQLGNGTTTTNTTANPPTVISNFTNVTATNRTSTQTQTELTFYHFDCTNLIAKVQSTGLSPITGSTTAKVWLETSQPANFVTRHYEITPATNANTATGRVTLYFTQAEFDAFNAVNTLKLPTSSADSVGKANVRIEKRSSISSNGSGLPATYSSTNTTIDPNDADIVWNGTNNCWEITFDVTGFSGFFLKTQAALLPITLISFNATMQNNNDVVVKWQSANEVNANQYQVESNFDGNHFETIGSVKANNVINISNYQFTDKTTWANELRYYRLKSVDNDGSFKYSNIVGVTKDKPTHKINVYPNPAAKEFTIVTQTDKLLNTTAILLNVIGKQVKTIQINNLIQTVDASDLNNGMYLLQFADGSNVKIFKQ